MSVIMALLCGRPRPANSEITARMLARRGPVVLSDRAGGVNVRDPRGGGMRFGFFDQLPPFCALAAVAIAAVTATAANTLNDELNIDFLPRPFFDFDP